MRSFTAPQARSSLPTHDPPPLEGGWWRVGYARYSAIAVVILGVLFAGFMLLSAPAPRFSRDDPHLKPGDPARGQQIFAAADCDACHATPGQTNRLLLGGGLALASPFGTFRAPNISPDPIDGIGSWQVADLANALIAGVSPQGQHYYPAFPYTSYTSMTIGDVEDLYAYLRTLPATSGRPPAHDLALPFRIRRAIGLWKLVFFDMGGSQAMLNGDPIHDRGAYLVETLGHCAECHSTRNLFYAIKPDTRFAGGPDPEGSGFVPNMTPGRIGHWTEADLSKMLETGETPDHGRVGSSMTDVVNNTALLPQSDRDAIARYIKSLPARPTPHP